jgi:hypothetical protein
VDLDGRVLEADAHAGQVFLGDADDGLGSDVSRCCLRLAGFMWFVLRQCRRGRLPRQSRA